LTSARALPSTNSQEAAIRKQNVRKEEHLVRSWSILADLRKADPHILAR
jgi:hypothetical protein